MVEIFDSKIFNPWQKVSANIDRAIELWDTGTTSPVLVEIDPSNACNHSCPFCISGYIHLPESSDLDTFSRVIMPDKILFDLLKDLGDLDVKAINWTGGGEPTVNPALKEAMEWTFCETNIRQGMFTNGTLLQNFDLIDVVVTSLDWIRFSIDSGKPESYNSIRRPKSGQGYDTMRENVDKVLETRENYWNICLHVDATVNTELGHVASHPGNPIVGVGMVIVPENYEEIVDFAHMWKDVDVDYVQFKPEIVNREREDGVQREIAFWDKVEPELVAAKLILGDKYQVNRYKLSDLINDPKKFGRYYKKCFGSQLQPCVGADGEVYVCTNLRGYKEYSYGSLHEKSFKEIWADLDRRKKIMHRIEDQEQFCNCTELCKAHASSQALWNIHEIRKSAVNKDRFDSLLLRQQEEALRDVVHPEFI